MIFTSLMSLWRISYQKFSCFTLTGTTAGTGSSWWAQFDGYWMVTIERLISFFGGNRSFSFSGFNKSLQRLLAYGFLGLSILFTALIGVNCGGEEEAILRTQEKLPEKPTLRAQAGDGNVSLFWNRLQNATNYMVYMNDKPHREMSGEGNNDEMNFTVDKLNNGDMYSFQVAGMNAQGQEGEKSDVVERVPRPGELAPVKDLENSEFGDKEVTLTWKKVEYATDYRIYRSGPADKAFNISTQGDIEEDAIVKTDTTTHTDSGLENGKHYLYQVEPIMEIPDEEPVVGERKSFTGRPVDSPKKRPGVNQRLLNSNDNTCSIVLNLTKPTAGDLTDSTGYKVAFKEVNTSSDAESSAFIRANTSSSRTVYFINNLDYGKSYQVIVTASKSTTGVGGVTEEEEKFQRETSPLLCERKDLDQPKAPTVIRRGDVTLKVSWSLDPRATHYKIILYNADGSERDESPLEKTIADLGGDSCCSYEDTGLSDGTTYKYTIRAVLKIGSDVLESLESPQGTGVAKSLIIVDPMDYADPIIATGSSISPSGDTGYRGNERTNNSIGSHYPFGMATIAPLNSLNKSRDGDSGGLGDRWTNYDNRKHRVKAFAMTDIPGPGCDLASDFPFMLHDGDQSSSKLDSIIPLYIKGMEPASNKHTSSDTTNSYDKTNVEAKPGYLAMTFSNDIEFKSTVGPRSGIAEFTLPSTVSTATLFFTTGSRMSRHSTSISSANSLTSQSNSIQGMIHNQGFCCNNCSAHKIYMVALFQQTPNSTTPVIKSNVDSKTYDQAAYVFDKSTVGNKIRIKFGLSYVSYAGAWGNLQAEIPNWDFAQRQTDTQSEWSTMLKRIQVPVVGETEEAKRKNDLTIFYSSLYKALRTPQIFSDVDHKYIGFNNSIYRTEQVGGRYRIQYQYFSGWDTYRSQMQLVALIDRELAGDMAQSIINNSKQADCSRDSSVDGANALRIDNDGNIAADASCNGGGLTRWGVANDDSGIMAGEPGAIIVANSLAMGVTNFSMDQAFDAMVRGQSGARTDNKESSGSDSHYTNSDSSRNRTRSNALELASAYFAKAAFAKRLEKFKSDSNFAAKYSFNPAFLVKTSSTYAGQATAFFQDNVIQFRLGASGNDSSIPSSVTRLNQNNSYQEGNSHQYQWMYPPNVAGTTYSIVSEHFSSTVATAISGLNGHLSNLNVGGRTDGLFFGNEPGHFTPFVYCFLDQANVYKTQEVVRRIQKDLFKNQVHNAMAGNDDLGAMSAWYVWSAIGLYPSIPGLGHFNVSSPLFEQMIIDFGGSGHTLTIQTTGETPTSKNKQYIKNLKLNNVDYSKAYFSLDDLVGMGSATLIEFDLTDDSAQAKKTWTLAPSFAAIGDLDSHL